MHACRPRPSVGGHPTCCVERRFQNRRPVLLVRILGDQPQSTAFAALGLVREVLTPVWIHHEARQCCAAAVARPHSPVTVEALAHLVRWCP